MVDLFVTEREQDNEKLRDPRKSIARLTVAKLDRTVTVKSPINKIIK